MGVEGGVEQTLGGWSVAGSSELVEKSSKGQTKVEGWRGVAVVAQSMRRHLGTIVCMQHHKTICVL